MSSTVGTSNGDGQTPVDTTLTPAGTPATLVCPDDATQALTWLPAAQLMLTRAYDQLPPPERPHISVGESSGAPAQGWLPPSYSPPASVADPPPLHNAFRLHSE